MGQKSNPILLRLEKTNQQWISCWYNDHNYATQFLDDYKVNTYIQNCSQQLKKISPSLFIKRDRGQIQISFFSPHPARRFFSPRMNRRRNTRRLLTNNVIMSTRFTAVNSRKFAQIGGLVQYQGNNVKMGGLLGDKARVLKNALFMGSLSYSPLILVNSYSQSHLVAAIGESLRQFYLKEFWCCNLYKAFLSTVEGLRRNAILSLKPKGRPLARTRGRRVETPLKNHIESSICAQLFYRCKVHLLKCPSIHQNPLFLTSQIVFLLQERVSFRQLKHRLIEQVSKDATIQGIRIVCSGRVAARSKKAQKARKESIQWGETSLNVFSELVHFASKKAQTTFGKIGVKVWICYKQPRHAITSSHGDNWIFI